MYKILERQDLAANIHQFRIEAANIARKARAGQFVILRVDETGERIPLTIADWDREAGSVSIIFYEAGRTTRKLAALKEGDSIANFVGPMGCPTEIENFGSVVCVALGYSIATIIPIARALKEAGNRVVSLIWATNHNALFGEESLKKFSDRLVVVTGDGSSGQEGFILDSLKTILASRKVNRVFTAGPACVMKLVAATTKPFAVKTIASLNPIMVDGTGMCGCCRVIIGGETKFACVDGPGFDAHQVDWDWLLARRCTYSGGQQPWLQYQCYYCAQW